jgi:hypothetical protein
MLCWYCYWGWPEEVYSIYQEAVERLDGYDAPLLFGPSHIVWEEENFDCAEWCLEHFDEYRGDYSEKELTVVRESLEKLVALPLSRRDIEPPDYDGRHPENYPPPPGVQMVRR